MFYAYIFCIYIYDSLRKAFFKAQSRMELLPENRWSSKMRSALIGVFEKFSKLGNILHASIKRKQNKWPLWLHTDIPTKEILSQKGFLLVYLFTTFFNWSHQGANICGRTIFFTVPFTSLNVSFLKFLLQTCT